ncbi:MAG: glycoside hydrolase family 2 TIM barrel-domain containing protein, partial [Armatimonadota bacterium]
MTIRLTHIASCAALATAVIAVSGVSAKDAETPAGQSNIKYVLAAPYLNPEGVEAKLWFINEPPAGTMVQLTVGSKSVTLPYGQKLFLPLPGAPKWTPDTPNLLNLTVKIGADQKTVRFGLRRVEAKGEKLLLNGQPLYIQGFGTDGNDNGQLRRQVTTVKGYRNYVNRAKEFGFNTMRSHMPDNDRPQAFLDACDELGLFIWAEFEPGPNDVDKLAPFWNHPSVMWWCWGNEMAGIGTAPWNQAAYKFVHETDPSRLIQDNSGWGQYDRPTTDVINQHMGYYFPYGPRVDCYSSYALFTAEGSMLGKSMDTIMQEMRDGTFRLGKPLLAHETGNHQTFPDVIRRKDRMNFSARPAILAKMQLDNRLAHLDRWVTGSGKFKQAMDKVWMEQVRKSPIVEGYEMWMLADHGYAFCGVIEDGEDCRIKPQVSPAFYRKF